MEGKTRRAGAIRVLFFYDVAGWAWWNKIRHIKRHASPALAVDMLPVGAAFDHADYDFVVIFEHFFLRRLGGVPREKIVVGCCCPRTLDGLAAALPGSGVAAALLNNLAAYEALKGVYRAYYCPNGVDEALFTPSPTPATRFSVCWVGNGASIGDKGLPRIRAACAMAKVPLLALDQEENIAQGRILDQTTLRDTLYRKAAAYVCASRAEGTPNPCLEAMACGLPVVTTPVGNMPELVVAGENGFFCSGEIEDLAAALTRLREADWRAMGRNARAAIVSGWTWKRNAARYEAMFRELAGAPELPETA